MIMAGLFQSYAEIPFDNAKGVYGYIDEFYIKSDDSGYIYIKLEENVTAGGENEGVALTENTKEYYYFILDPATNNNLREIMALLLTAKTQNWKVFFRIAGNVKDGYNQIHYVKAPR